MWQAGRIAMRRSFSIIEIISPNPPHMSRPKKNPILTQAPLAPNEKYIKVRLDPRTTVLLKSMKNFAYWKEKYPNAEVIG